MSGSREEPTPINPVGLEPPADDRSKKGVVGAAAVVVIILVALGLGNRTPPGVEPDTLPEVERQLVRMPDLGGQDVDGVATLLEEAGLSEGGTLAVRWIANQNIPVGSVVHQTPAPDQAVHPDSFVEVEVSAGGPVVTLSELPAYAQALVSSENAEPILVTQTEAGPAYKTDGVSFGSCAAVEAAARHYRDSAYESRCPPDASTSVTGWLLDGTAFIVDGLPPARYVPDGMSGSLMVDLPDGTSRALGLSRFTRLPFTSPPVATRTVNLLTIAAGPWRHQVVLDEPLLTLLRNENIDVSDGAISPWVADGHLALDIGPPLRLQRPHESVTSAVGVSYGDITVQAGCWSLPTTVCDATGQISVTLPDTILPKGVSISVIDSAWSFLSGTGWSLAHPKSWTMAISALTPDLAYPAEVVSLSTTPVSPGGGACAHVPESALRQLGPTDVLISIYYGGHRENARPHQFGDDTMPSLEAGDDFRVCSDRPDLDVRWDAFDFEGTGTYVLVAYGPDVNRSDEAAAWAILNTFRFTGQG